MENNWIYIGIEIVNQAISLRAYFIVAYCLGLFCWNIVKTAETKSRLHSRVESIFPTKFVSIFLLPSNSSREYPRTSLNKLLGRRHSPICSVGLDEVRRRVASGVAEDELQMITIAFTIAECPDAYGQLEDMRLGYVMRAHVLRKAAVGLEFVAIAMTSAMES